MKKTIIALLALGGIAMGITLDELTYTAGNAATTTEDATFSYVLTLDVAQLKKLLEKGQPVAAWGTKIVEYTCNDTATGIVVNGSGPASKIASSSLYAKWGDNIAWGNFMTDGASSIDLADLNGEEEGTGWSDVLGAAITYSFSSSAGTKGALTLVGANDTVIINHNTTMEDLKSSSATGAAISFGDVVTGYYYSNDVLTVADAKEASKLAAFASIPEPTSATLSLLALAGLAMRRRRK
ncbi:MAG: PEP-CTERM sorting domain-containing protein [Bacteroidaceae bacterium]|nr:PEP-CTERM sorting domain-containing protein [Bacteroidaceae bacterium]